MSVWQWIVIWLFIGCIFDILAKPIHKNLKRSNVGYIRAARVFGILFWPIYPLAFGYGILEVIFERLKSKGPKS